MTLDCTVFVVASISKPLRPPPYGGHSSLHTLLHNVGTTTAEAVARLHQLCDFTDTLNGSPIDGTMIRVSLDVMRWILPHTDGEPCLV